MNATHFAPTLLEDGLDEFEGEPAQPVPVSNGNFVDISLEHSLHQGFKPFALPVNSACDIADDVPVGVDVFEVLDLAVEVFFLLVA